MNLELFDVAEEGAPRLEPLGPGAVVLRGFATPEQEALLVGLQGVIAQAPFRHMVTPGGLRMSVAMTNCGSLGWVTDRSGYRYTTIDPETGKHWPPMPSAFVQLAENAAAAAGFQGFVPDACLVNQYQPGTRLSLHQDKNERDLNAPIVSVSLGLPADFLFGGSNRADRAARVSLKHGDVVVWGGPARMRYHGVMPLEEGYHPVVGDHRINLTFRKAV